MCEVLQLSELHLHNDMEPVVEKHFFWLQQEKSWAEPAAKTTVFVSKTKRCLIVDQFLLRMFTAGSLVSSPGSDTCRLEEKETFLGSHSEGLAVTLSLLASICRRYTYKCVCFYEKHPQSKHTRSNLKTEVSEINVCSNFPSKHAGQTPWK